VSTSSYHVAQLNIGRLLAPLDDPQIADFVAILNPINALADRDPGFVWRFQTPEGNATTERPYDDDRILINLSVWKSVEALRAFVYSGEHAAVMQRRREWFERMTDVYVALWWVPAGHLPSVAEAVERLEHLKRVGPSPEVFTFRQVNPAPDTSGAEIPIEATAVSLEDPCPAN
jgi:heme-degrading monooxygenase HmoA